MHKEEEISSPVSRTLLHAQGPARGLGREDANCPGRQPEFSPWDPHHGRRGLSVTSTRLNTEEMHKIKTKLKQFKKKKPDKSKKKPCAPRVW